MQIGSAQVRVWIDYLGALEIRKETRRVRVNLGGLLLAASLGLSGCVSTIVDATTDAAIAVVKIPFKIGGAAVDMMKGKDPDEVGDERRARAREQRKNPAHEGEDQPGDDDNTESEAQTRT